MEKISIVLWKNALSKRVYRTMELETKNSSVGLSRLCLSEMKMLITGCPLLHNYMIVDP